MIGKEMQLTGVVSSTFREAHTVIVTADHANRESDAPMFFYTSTDGTMDERLASPPSSLFLSSLL
jgi:hypothetical protein